jgi:hypothetical protein
MAHRRSPQDSDPEEDCKHLECDRQEENEPSIQDDIHGLSRPLVGKELACIGWFEW